MPNVLTTDSEGYHVQTLHRISVKDMVCAPTNPNAYFLSVDFLGPHVRVSSPRNPEFAVAEHKQVQQRIFATIPQVVVSSGVKASFDIPGINPTQDPLWGNEMFVIFPNTVVHLAHNGLWTYRFWPIAADRFRLDAHYHFAKPASRWSEKWAMEGSLAYNRDIGTEDLACVVRQFDAMQAGAKPYVQFGVNELVCRYLAAVREGVLSVQENARLTAAAE